MADVKAYFDRAFTAQSEPPAPEVERAKLIAGVIPSDVKSAFIALIIAIGLVMGIILFRRKSN